MNSKIERMRESLGMSRCVFAKHAGVSEAAIRKWEANGTSKAQAGVLLKASKRLGVSVESLIDEG